MTYLKIIFFRIDSWQRIMIFTPKQESSSLSATALYKFEQIRKSSLILFQIMTETIESQTFVLDNY